MKINTGFLRLRQIPFSCLGKRHREKAGLHAMETLAKIVIGR